MTELICKKYQNAILALMGYLTMCSTSAWSQYPFRNIASLDQEARTDELANTLQFLNDSLTTKYSDAPPEQQFSQWCVGCFYNELEIDSAGQIKIHLRKLLLNEVLDANGDLSRSDLISEDHGVTTFQVTDMKSLIVATDYPDFFSEGTQLGYVIELVAKKDSSLNSEPDKKIQLSRRTFFICKEKWRLDFCIELWNYLLDLARHHY